MHGILAKTRFVTLLSTKMLNTVDLEIFVLLNFRVLNFRVKIFSWSRIPTKIFFTVYVPRFSDLEQNYAR